MLLVNSTAHCADSSGNFPFSPSSSLWVIDIKNLDMSTERK